MAHGLQKGGQTVSHATVAPSTVTETPNVQAIAPAQTSTALSQDLINSTSISGKSPAALAVEHTMAIMKAK